MLSPFPFPLPLDPLTLLCSLLSSFFLSSSSLFSLLPGFVVFFFFLCSRLLHHVWWGGCRWQERGPVAGSLPRAAGGPCDSQPTPVGWFLAGLLLGHAEQVFFRFAAAAVCFWAPLSLSPTPACLPPLRSDSEGKRYVDSLVSTQDAAVDAIRRSRELAQSSVPFLFPFASRFSMLPPPPPPPSCLLTSLLPSSSFFRRPSGRRGDPCR